MSMCERFKEIILTDYIDGEAAPEIRKMIDAHFLACPDCKAFAQSVQSELVAPFQKAVREPVPAELWSSIKEKIEEERRDPVLEFIGRMIESLRLPRLTPAFAGLAVMLLVGLTVFHGRSVAPVNEKEQTEYLVSILDFGDFSDGDTNELGTSIEQYFL